jgi:hypothetical protein
MQLTESEFETMAEKFRANFIGNQQTSVATLKQYVAEVNAARGVRGGSTAYLMIITLKTSSTA